MACCWIILGHLVVVVSTAIIVCGVRNGVRSFLCPSVQAWPRSSKPAAADLLPWVAAGRRYRSIAVLRASAQQQQRANAGSATLSACVESWTQTDLLYYIVSCDIVRVMCRLQLYLLMCWADCDKRLKSCLNSSLILSTNDLCTFWVCIFTLYDIWLAVLVAQGLFTAHELNLRTSVRTALLEYYTCVEN